MNPVQITTKLDLIYHQIINAFIVERGMPADTGPHSAPCYLIGHNINSLSCEYDIFNKLFFCMALILVKIVALMRGYNSFRLKLELEF